MKYEPAFTSLQGNTALFLFMASWCQFHLRQQILGACHIPITERRLLLRCLWKVGIPLDRSQRISSHLEIIWCTWSFPPVAVQIWCSSRLGSVFSGNLWSFLKEVKPLVMFDGECGISLVPMQGNRASSQIDLGYTELFLLAVVSQGHSRLVTVFLRTLWCFIKEVKVPYMSDGEQGIALPAMQGNRASSRGDGEVSWFFASCGGNLGYILELQWGWRFKTCVCSATSGLLSSCEGHLGILFEAW